MDGMPQAGGGDSRDTARASRQAMEAFATGGHDAMAPPSVRCHEVAVLAMHGVVAADLAVAVELFGRVRLACGADGYTVRVCGEAEVVRSEAFDLRPPFPLEAAATADTVIVPGSSDPTAQTSPAILETLREAGARGARVASICTGAFHLAAAGLLEGRRATTHWLAAPALASLYPSIEVDPDVLYVDEGAVVTSAGACAGIDMCLHLIRRDHGRAVAAASSRLAVCPIDREGGQAQFIRHEAPASVSTVAPLLDWMAANLAGPISLGALARRAGTTPRTLSRRFREQVGSSAMGWLSAARLRRAQELLEATDLPIDVVAATVGLGVSTFRQRFRLEVGVSPSRFRANFNAAPSGHGSPFPRSSHRADRW